MKRIKSVNLLFLILVLLHIGVSFVLGYAEINMTVNQSLIFSQALVAVPGLIYLIVTKANIREMIPFKKLGIGTVFKIILFTYLMIPLMAVANAVSLLFSSNVVGDTMGFMMENPFWLNLVLIAVIPAINEEFIFRGIFYHTYRKKSMIGGALACGILFGLMHLNFNQFSYALLLGVLFALLIEATGSIFAPMLAHLVINGNSLILVTLSNKLMQLMEGNEEFFDRMLEGSGQTLETAGQITTEQLIMAIGIFGVTAVITTAIGACVFVWISKGCNTQEHIQSIFRRKRKDVVSQEGLLLSTDIKKEKGSFITLSLILAALISIAFMILAETM